MKNNLKKIFIILIGVVFIPSFSFATSTNTTNKASNNKQSNSAVITSTPKKEEELIKEIEKQINSPANNKEESAAKVLEFSKKNDNTLVESKDSGNLNVIPEKRQFITIVTKENEIFYMIIDYSSNTKNVKLLKEVTNKDMTKLLTNEEISEVNSEISKSSGENTNIPSTTIENSQKSLKLEEKNNTNKILEIFKNNLHIVVPIIAIPIYFIFFRKKKNNKKMKKNPEYINYDYDDDETIY